ncbi:MAG: XRE family transcriptional regulator [Acidobacteriota bacterium]
MLSAGEASSNPSENSEETIQRVLSGYDLGRKLRQLRLKKKLGLVELGRHTGLSASMLSQLENGKLIPTLPTLARIAMVFDVGLDFFFADTAEQRSFHRVRAQERIRFPEKPELRSPGYFFESLAFTTNNKGLQGYWALFPPREEEFSLPHTHEGQEMIYVVEGTLTVRHNGEDYEMEAGDSAYFDAAEVHSYRGELPDGAKAIIATTAGKL